MTTTSLRGFLGNKYKNHSNDLILRLVEEKIITLKDIDLWCTGTNTIEAIPIPECSIMSKYSEWVNDTLWEHGIVNLMMIRYGERYAVHLKVQYGDGLY